MPTLMTDPRSGGVKKKSGVQVLPIVAETWAKVRDDSDPSIDWLIASYEGKSKTDVTVLDSGFGGIDICSQHLPHDKPVFGGCRLKSGRFVTFYYVDEEHTSVIVRGRAAMHKNGVLNVLEGADCEIDMRNGLIEEDVILGVVSAGGASNNNSSSDAGTRKTHVHSSSSATTYSSYTAVSKEPSKDYEEGGTVVTTRIIRGGAHIHPEKKVTTTSFHSGEGETVEEVVQPDDAGGETTTTTTKVIRRVVQEQAPPPPTKNQTVTTKTIQTANGDTTTVTTTVTEVQEMEYFEAAIVPYAFIKGIRDPKDLPPGVDPDNREMSLSDREFMDVFGMDKFKWQSLPTWKKKGMRREKDLF